MRLLGLRCRGTAPRGPHRKAQHDQQCHAGDCQRHPAPVSWRGLRRNDGRHRLAGRGAEGRCSSVGLVGDGCHALMWLRRLERIRTRCFVRQRCRCSCMRFPHNRRHQAIPGLGDGLDVLRALPAVAGKGFTQLRDRLGHHIVGRQGIGPHLGKQLLACDHLARLARQGSATPPEIWAPGAPDALRQVRALRARQRRPRTGRHVAGPMALQ